MLRTALKRIALKDGTNMFYREVAGPSTASTLLLLHGFPSSSHQYRNLIPLLGERYHVIAPDMPGFGFTTVPSSYTYTFANLTKSIIHFLDALHLSRFSMFIFDFGAPVGLRLALQRPGSISAIITQNGNAYAEGLGKPWDFMKTFWATDGNRFEREKIRAARVNFDRVKNQYVDGTRDPDSQLAPESYTLDYALLSRPEMGDAYVDMFWDYRTNVDMYPDFQEYFRKTQVPLLAVWGEHDVSFIPPGAWAFQKDLPDAEVRLLDAGHFAAETNTEEVAEIVLEFLDRKKVR